MTNARRFTLDELTIRPGTYFNPQTEVMIVVDDSPEVDHELFETSELDNDEWVLIADEVPVDEHKRDELVERFQHTYQAGGELLAEDDVTSTRTRTCRRRGRRGRADEPDGLSSKRRETFWSAGVLARTRRCVCRARGCPGHPARRAQLRGPRGVGRGALPPATGCNRPCINVGARVASPSARQATRRARARPASRSAWARTSSARPPDPPTLGTRPRHVHARAAAKRGPTVTAALAALLHSGAIPQRLHRRLRRLRRRQTLAGPAQRHAQDGTGRGPRQRPGDRGRRRVLGLPAARAVPDARTQPPVVDDRTAARRAASA